eukprot:11097449-Ditylum_brightwellii.AAC.1
MSIALDLCCLMELLTIPLAVELFIIMVMGGWGCPISSRAILNPTADLLLMNKAPTSASAADAINVLILVHSVCTTPLFLGSWLDGFV